MADTKALVMICEENNIVKMRQALAGGINPNQRLNENGIKALHIVARRGHQEMVSLLLQQPDIELNPKTQNTWTPLHLAAFHGHHEVVALFLQQPGIELNPKTQNKGDTPLHLAAFRGHQEVVALLLQQPGIDTNTACLQGWTALHVAASKSQEEIVALLLDHPGIEAGATNTNGNTALHNAVCGHAGPGVLRRLLACTSIDPNVKNVGGKTPIMWLLQRDGNQVERLRAFVECDKVDLDDQDGRSLEDLAR